MELTDLDATGQADLVRRGESSPTELVQASIDAIERLDPQLDAVLHRSFDRALRRAARPQPQPTGTGRFQLFRIGDAVASRNIHAAIYDAHRLCLAV